MEDSPGMSRGNLILEKVRSGIAGFDDISQGGLPKGRPCLVVGSAGSGKTLFAMEFLCRGAELGESGVLLSFEENRDDLHINVASLGLDSPRLERENKLRILEMRIEPEEGATAGGFDLSGLFARLEHAVNSVGAQRVVIDTIDVLFSNLAAPGLLRAELSRLFLWLKERKLTTVITAERPDTDHLTRHGLEEFVSDCVIALDHRIHNAVSTRRLRIVKYRGSLHGTNEYPFLIGDQGIQVIPITSMGLDYVAGDERISMGIPGLDKMLDGGIYQASTALISGTAGMGKTTFAALAAQANASTDQRVLYLLFEESPSQVKRNMRSVGLDLDRWECNGMLRMVAMRPQAYGLEQHLVHIIRLINEFKPNLLIVDPISAWNRAGEEMDSLAAIIRLVDYVKSHHISMIMTAVQSEPEALQVTSGLDVSSVIDSWIMLRSIEGDGERNRGLFIIKSRGMSHSNQIREYLITHQGVDLIEPYIGPDGVLTGMARQVLETRENLEKALRQNELNRLEADLLRKDALLEANINALQQKAAMEKAEITARIQAAQLNIEMRQDAQNGRQRSRSEYTLGSLRASERKEP